MGRAITIVTIPALFFFVGCNVEDDIGKQQGDAMVDSDPGLGDGSTPDTGPDPDGQTGQDGPLAPDQAVAEAGTTPCTPNLATCIDMISYKKCNSAGNGYLPQVTCPVGKRCDKGGCVNTGPVYGDVHVAMEIGKTWPSAPLTFFGRLLPAFYHGGGAAWTYPTVPAETCKVIPVGTYVPPTTFDAGKVDYALPAGNFSASYNTKNKGYKTVVIKDAQFPYGKTVTFSSKGNGLVRTAFTGKITLPPKRIMTQPSSHVSQNKNQPLTIKWSGATNTGQVWISLLGDNMVVPKTYCSVTDDGEFTLPASVFATYSSNATLYLRFEAAIFTAFSAKGLTSGRGIGTVMQTEGLSIQ